MNQGCCSECGTPLFGMYSNAITCSEACRARRSRRMRKHSRPSQQGASMNEVEYERQEEIKAMGNHCAKCMQWIMHAQEAETLSELQRLAYKYTDAGISVAFQFWDGTVMWAGDPEDGPPDEVIRIGFSSIVEGSDGEVPLRWMDLSEMESPEAAEEEYDRLVQATNDLACALWDEANAENDEVDE